MAHLIDKSALVAEIERLISNGQTKLKESEECKDYESYVALAERIATCINVLSILDTLEVKEVDLELNSFDATVCKICNTYLKEMDKDAIVKALEPYKDGDKVKVIIKATQKGE